jgi:hypothetical protein
MMSLPHPGNALLTATGSCEAGLAIVQSVVRTTYDFEHEPAAMLSARAQLAAIEAAMG